MSQHEAQHAKNLSRIYLDLAGDYAALASAIGTGLPLCAAQARRSIRTLTMRAEAETRRMAEVQMREQAQAIRADALNAQAMCSAGLAGREG